MITQGCALDRDGECEGVAISRQTMAILSFVMIRNTTISRLLDRYASS